MSETILARDLRAGDVIKTPDEGLVTFHRVPLKRTKSFTAHYARATGFTDFEVTYEPDEEIEIFARWLDRT